MQTSGNRSSFYRPATRRSTRVAGVGMAVGFMFAVAGLGACSPGSLPTDFPVNGVAPAAGGTTGSNTGGAPGPAAGGSVGSMGGSGGTPSAGGDIGTRPLANCAAYATVNDYETKLLVPQCGKSGCHVAGGLAPPDMAMPNIYSRLLDKFVSYAATTCDKGKDKLIDSSGTAETSFFVAKMRDKMPKCPSGAAGGLQMPFGLAALPQSDIDCTVAYVKAVLGK
jgi:hypothetical protein